jgi:hypothetical protein
MHAGKKKITIVAAAAEGFLLLLVYVCVLFKRIKKTHRAKHSFSLFKKLPVQIYNNLFILLHITYQRINEMTSFELQ